MARLQFALWALKARFLEQHQHCPYCGSILHMKLQRKKLLIEARKCQYCGLIFRWPTDSACKAEHYYDREYRSGLVTDLPEATELKQLAGVGFKGSRFDASRYVELVKEVCPSPASILDFGASWGYVGFQFASAGYEVEGFELSPSRAEFGRSHLGLSLHSSWGLLAKAGLPRFNMVFSAHTLEHVYDLKGTLRHIAEALLPGGKLMIIVPNGGGLKARQLGAAWGPYLGETHTIAFTSTWLRQILPFHGFGTLVFFSQGPFERDFQCDGEELICTAQLNGTQEVTCASVS